MNNQFQNIDEVLEETGRRLREAMVNNLIQNGSLGTGKLARSIQDKVYQDGKGLWNLDILMEQYGVYVDKGIGRGPGKQPPVQPLINWINQKKIPRPANMSVREFAWAIARKIAKEGTDPKPRPFIQPAVTLVMNQYFNQAIQQAGIQDIDKFINNSFKMNGGTLT